jgi:hypothetical protein
MIAELSVRELRSLSLRFIKEHGHNIDVDEVKAFIVKEEREFLLINNSSMGPLEYKTIAFKRIKVLL